MRAPLQSIETTRPLEVVGIDIVEFTKSKSGNHYGLVMVDLFTKYLNIYLLKHQTANMFAWHIQNKYVCQHRAHEQLHSDQGKNLNAQTVKDVSGYLYIWKTRTTPYRPQSDGQTERTISTVVDLLAKYCSEAQNDWDEYLDSIACAYNSTVHESTEFSPYFLQHGREMRLPIDLETGPTQQDSRSSITEFARKLKSEMNDAFAVAQQNLGKACQIQKSTYD